MLVKIKMGSKVADKALEKIWPYLPSETQNPRIRNTALTKARQVLQKISQHDEKLTHMLSNKVGNVFEGKSGSIPSYNVHMHGTMK